MPAIPRAQTIALRSSARGARTEVLRQSVSAMRLAKEGVAGIDAHVTFCCIVAVLRAELRDRERTERAITLGFYLRALDSARDWREDGNRHNALIALEHAARFRAALLAKPAPW